MRWWDGITNPVDVNLSQLQEIVEDTGAWRAGVHEVTKSPTRLSDWTTTTRVVRTSCSRLAHLAGSGCVTGTGSCLCSSPNGAAQRLSSSPSSGTSILSSWRWRWAKLRAKSGKDKLGPGTSLKPKSSGRKAKMGFPDSSVGKESACNAGDPGLIPGLGRSPREGIGYWLQYSWSFLVAQLVKNLPVVWKTEVWFLGWEDPLENGKATLTSILENSMDCIVHGVTKSQINKQYTYPCPFALTS